MSDSQPTIPVLVLILGALISGVLFTYVFFSGPTTPPIPPPSSQKNKTNNEKQEKKRPPLYEDHEHNRPDHLQQAYRFTPGQVFTYEMTYSTDVTQEVTGGNTSSAVKNRTVSFGLSVSGTWTVRVYRKNNTGNQTEYLLGWQLSQTTISTTSRNRQVEMPDAARKSFTKEVLVRMTEQGNIIRLFFPSDLPAMTRNFWNTWSEYGVIPFPDEKTNNWTRTGTSNFGTYVESYQLRDDGVLVRNRQKYTEIQFSPAQQSGNEKKAVEPEETDLTGQMVYLYSTDGGHLASASGTPQMKTVVPFLNDARIQFRSRNDIHFSLLDQSTHDQEQLASRALRTFEGNTWKEILDALASSRKGTPALADGSDRKQMNQAPDASFEELFSMLETLISKNASRTRQAALFREMNDLITAKPDVIPKVKRSILAQDTPPRAYGLLLDALADAGTEPAQQALADILETSEKKRYQRTLQALSNLQSARPPVREAVRNGLANTGPNSPSLPHLLRAAGSIVPKDPETSDDSLFQALKEQGETNLTESARVAYLNALGNSGRASAYPVLKQHIDEAHTGSVRSAAHTGLGHLESQEAADTLLSYVRSNPDDPLHQTAVNALALQNRIHDRPPRSTEVYNTFSNMLNEQKGSATTRVQILEYLRTRMAQGKQVDRSAIRRAARQDPDADVRKRARQILNKRSNQ